MDFKPLKIIDRISFREKKRKEYIKKVEETKAFEVATITHSSIMYLNNDFSFYWFKNNTHDRYYIELLNKIGFKLVIENNQNIIYKHKDNSEVRIINSIIRTYWLHYMYIYPPSFD